jgi:hypothetical protein
MIIIKAKLRVDFRSKFLVTGVKSGVTSGVKSGVFRVFYSDFTQKRGGFFQKNRSKSGVNFEKNVQIR